MKKLITAAVMAGALLVPAAALASVDTNLATTVKKVEWYAPKWVIINGTHTAYSGNFSGTVCSSQWVSTSNQTVVYYSYAMRFTFGNTSTYTNNGNYVNLRDVIATGIAC